MNQLIYSPLRSLNELHRGLDRVFDDRFFEPAASSYEEGNWTPTVDIKEDANSFKVYADIPGVSPKDVEITLDKNTLSIKGERTESKNEEGENYKRRERIQGVFVRQFTLPDTADGKGISAKAKEGVLEITIPKGEKHKPRAIKVAG